MRGLSCTVVFAQNDFSNHGYNQGNHTFKLMKSHFLLKCVTLLLLLYSGLFSIARAQTGLKLWYSKPATQWDQALP
jgi:hypothetical protein